jgi:hypothetical protein
LQKTKNAMRPLKKQSAIADRFGLEPVTEVARESSQNEGVLMIIGRRVHGSALARG